MSSEKDFVEYLKGKIAERAGSYERSILKGTPSTFEAYKEKVGRASAYRDVIDVLDFELQKYLEEDDD